MSGKKITASFYEQRFKTGAEWQELIDKIVKKTGFRPKGEYFANVVYFRDKIGALHILGEYRGKKASLKIQGIDPGSDEGKNLFEFSQQNRSNLIRAPEVYQYQPYSQDQGYGFLIWEQVNGKPLRKICQTGKEHLENFSRFYLEFRSKALNAVWRQPNKKGSLESAEEYVEVLEKVYQEGKTAVLEKLGFDFRLFGKEFLALVEKHNDLWKKEFTHGHLGPDDILIDQEGKFVIFSNLYWGWYPVYYDFVFYFWALSLEKKTFAGLKRLYWLWLNECRKIKGKNFSPELFKLTILERLLGSILVQLGVNNPEPTLALKAAISLFNFLKN